MEKESNTLEINICDQLKFKDSAGTKRRNMDYDQDVIIDKRRPAGVVQIYEIDKETGQRKLLRKKNLVTYTGREWIASRLVGLENGNVDQSPDEVIRWAGLGSGALGDPLDPDSPANDNTALGEDIALNSTGGSGYADYNEISGEYFKKVINTDDIIFETDESNDFRWLVLKFSFQILPDDAVGKTINEAGLFTAESDVGPFHLFSRVTFPSIVKTIGRDLLFVWYVYC
jgi:hypothetical protein